MNGKERPSVPSQFAGLIGMEQRLPFRFQLLRSPWSYQVHLINVDYHLVARADLPLARDAVAKEQIVVLPGAALDEGEGHAKRGSKEAASGLDLVRQKPLASLTVSMVMLLILLALAYLFTPIFLVLVLIIGVKALRVMISERRLGKVQVSLGPFRVSPGSSVKTRVWFPKTERVEVRSLLATLSAAEICQSQEGGDRRTYNHILHEEVVTLEPSGHNEFRGELMVPHTDGCLYLQVQGQRDSLADSRTCGCVPLAGLAAGLPHHRDAAVSRCLREGDITTVMAEALRGSLGPPRGNRSPPSRIRSPASPPTMRRPRCARKAEVHPLPRVLLGLCGAPLTLSLSMRRSLAQQGDPIGP